jgi:D-alanyl-D-alanine carboxypeptidase (penicillin-binding protein 5/6)
MRGFPVDPVALQRLEARRRLRRSQIRRRRVTLVSVVALVSVLGYVAFGGGDGGPARASASGRALPGPVLTSLVVAHQVVPGTAGHLPWPSTGQGAIAVLGSGLVARSPKERAVPIASLTKIMTAVVLLQDHPLALGAGGPSIRITSADAASWVVDSQAGDSTVPVRVGEVLSEYQLLEALLLPSGDNIAELLARWDAGSIPAFVAKMNAEAQLLGLESTHYADSSGVDPGSVSTAADQAELTLTLMSFPVARRIVAYPSRPFPVAGTIWNFNPALGTDGIVGVKSGFTSQAQACLVTAGYRDVGGQSVLVVSASTGQPGGLSGAALTDEKLLERASRALVRYRILPADGVVGNARFAWSDAVVRLRAPGLPASIVTWPGTVLSERLAAGPRRLPASASAVPASLGSLVLRSSGGLLVSAPVRSAGPTPAVPAGWSATHG